MSCHEFGDGFAVHLLSFEVRLMSFGVRLMSLGVGFEQELRDEVGGGFDEFDEFGGAFDEFGAPFDELGRGFGKGAWR